MASAPIRAGTGQARVLAGSVPPRRKKNTEYEPTYTTQFKAVKNLPLSLIEVAQYFVLDVFVSCLKDLNPRPFIADRPRLLQVIFNFIVERGASDIV